MTLVLGIAGLILSGFVLYFPTHWDVMIDEDGKKRKTKAFKYFVGLVLLQVVIAIVMLVQAEEVETNRDTQRTAMQSDVDSTKEYMKTSLRDVRGVATDLVDMREQMELVMDNGEHTLKTYDSLSILINKVNERFKDEIRANYPDVAVLKQPSWVKAGGEHLIRLDMVNNGGRSADRVCTTCLFLKKDHRDVITEWRDISGDRVCEVIAPRTVSQVSQSLFFRGYPKTVPEDTLSKGIIYIVYSYYDRLTGKCFYRDEMYFWNDLKYNSGNEWFPVADKKGIRRYLDYLEKNKVNAYAIHKAKYVNDLCISEDVDLLR